MTQERRKDDHHPDRPLDWSDTETLAGQEWKAPAAPQAVAGKGEVPEGWSIELGEHSVPGAAVVVRHADGRMASIYKQAASPADKLLIDFFRDLAASPAAPAIPSPGAAEGEPVGYINPSEPIASDAFRWPGTALSDEYSVPVYTRASLSSPAERQDAEAARMPRDAACDSCFWGDCPPCASPASAEPVQVPGELTAERIGWMVRNYYGTALTALDIEFARAVEREVLARLATPSSPSVSGTVDTPEFKDALNQWVWANLGAETDLAYMAIIAHIDQHTAQAVRAAREEAAKWISVDERLPEGECLAVYVTPNGKQRLIRAKYARQFQIEAEGDDCETEYKEEDDTFYIKAGWLECIDNWGEYSSCYVTEGVVTHWTPLPRTPQAAGTEQAGEPDARS